MSDSEEKQLLEEQAAEAIKEEKKAAPKVYFSKVSKFNSLNLEKNNGSLKDIFRKEVENQRISSQQKRKRRYVSVLLWLHKLTPLRV